MQPTRWMTRAAWTAVALALAAGALQAALLLRDQQRNAAIATATAGGQPPADGGLPELQFAAAWAQAASGADEAALNRYRALQGDGPVGQAARYNTANLLVRQAVKLRETQQPGQAVPLLELAKETYREVLRHDPAHWPARYNLERAQRLLPDPEAGDDGPAEAPKNAERAATTMRGYSPGLP